MPSNQYFIARKLHLEAKFWRNRMDELVESLNELGFLMPKITLNQVLTLIVVFVKGN